MFSTCTLKFAGCTQNSVSIHEYYYTLVSQNALPFLVDRDPINE